MAMTEEERYEYDRLFERERVAKLITMDVLNAVDAIYGTDGLKAVTEHARRANKAREDNAKIDALEAAFANLSG